MLPIADFSDSVDRAWDEFFLWLPRFVGFLVILLLGYIVAKFVGGWSCAPSDAPGLTS